MQNVNLNQGQSVPVSIVGTLDVNGNEANPANGAPTWAAGDPSLTIVPAADGMSATVTAGQKPGVLPVNVTGQSIPFGPNFTTQFTVTVAKLAAAAFVFSFGTPS